MGLVTCQDFQNELYELFGVADLPEHLQAHLNECEQCRAILDELLAAGAHLGENDLFFMERAEGDQFLLDLNHELDALEQPRTFSLRAFFERLAPVAAAAVIMLAIGLPAHHWQQAEPTAAFDSVAVMDQIASLSGYETSDEYPSLDDQTVNALMEDYSSRPGEDASPTLLDDLSEEEWNYLNQNFDVGEIL